MRRPLSPVLILLACCLLVVPATGCGSKPGPPTIGDLLARARKNPKPEGRARDLTIVAGIQADSPNKAGAARTLADAERAIPDDGQPLVCVPVLVQIAETYGEIGQRNSGRKAMEKAVVMLESVEDPQGRSKLLADVAVAQAALGDRTAARASLETATTLAVGEVPERFRGKALAAVAMGYVDAELAAEAETVIETLEGLAAGLEDLRPKAEAYAAAAAVRAATGGREAATGLLAKAAEAAKAIDDLPANRAYALLAVAKAVNASGDRAGALELLDDADKSASAIGDPAQQKDALKKVRQLQAKLKG